MRMKKTTRKQLRTIRRQRLAMALVGAMAMPMLPAMAQSLPSGGTVIPGTGSATIGPITGNEMTITQTTKGAIIDWGSFNIGAGYGVTFDQQFGSSSVTLNRVIGFGYSGSGPSQIDGTLIGIMTLACYGLLRHLLLGPAWRWLWIGCFAAGIGTITKGTGQVHFTD